MRKLLNFISWNIINSTAHATGKSTILRGLTESVKLNDEELELVTERARKKVEYALMEIFSTHPFFARAASKLKYVYTLKTNVAATDGSHMLINPIEFEQMSIKEVIFVVLHEIMHCMLLHFLRVGDRNFRKFNEASDYEINLIVADETGFYIKTDAQHPKVKNGLYDEKYRGYSAEQIYDLLKDEKEDGDGGGGGAGSGEGGGGSEGGAGSGEGGEGGEGGESGEGGGAGSGEGGDWSNDVLSKEEIKRILDEEGVSENTQIRGTADEWNKEFIKAAQEHMRRKEAFGSRYGTGSSLLDKVIFERLKPKINWKEQFKRLVRSMFSGEKSVLPSKRHIYKGEYRTGTKPDYDAIKHIVFAVDTSGSMLGSEELIFAELKGILQQRKVKKISIVYFDTEIKSVDVLTGSMKIDTNKAKGGGGTSFKPIIEWVNDNANNPNLVIIMTDNENGDKVDVNLMPRPLWANKCIWVITNAKKAEKVPFGKILYISNDDIK